MGKTIRDKIRLAANTETTLELDGDEAKILSQLLDRVGKHDERFVAPEGCLLDVEASKLMGRIGK